MDQLRYPIDTLSNEYRTKQKQTSDADVDAEAKETQIEKETSDHRISPIIERRRVGNVAGLLREEPDGRVTATRKRLRLVSEVAP